MFAHKWPFTPANNIDYFHTYVDCEELLRFMGLLKEPGDLDTAVDQNWIKHSQEGPIISVPLTCCPDCAKLWVYLEQYKNKAEFECDKRKLGLHSILPPAGPGSLIHSDWQMNIEAMVCCHHFHLARSLSREQWQSLCKVVGAKPYVYIPPYRPAIHVDSRSISRPAVKRRVKACLFCGNETDTPEQICRDCQPKG